MNIRSWIAFGVAGFAIGAGVNGLQTLFSNDEQPASSADTTQQSNNLQGQFPTGLGTGEFQIPEDGEFQLPEGPFTLPDGTVVDVNEDDGTITLPDGTTFDVPRRPGGPGGRFGGQ